MSFGRQIIVCSLYTYSSVIWSFILILLQMLFDQRKVIYWKQWLWKCLNLYIFRNSLPYICSIITTGVLEWDFDTIKIWIISDIMTKYQLYLMVHAINIRFVVVVVIVLCLHYFINTYFVFHLTSTTVSNFHNKLYLTQNFLARFLNLAVNIFSNIFLHYCSINTFFLISKNFIYNDY